MGFLSAIGLKASIQNRAQIPDHQDTTLRPLCFGIGSMVNAVEAEKVGAEKFKRYEHALYLMAQLSRLAYCDTGVLWKVIEEAKVLGHSNDIVNKVITAYDWKYANERRQPVSTQAGDGAGRPMESYSLVPSKGQGESFGTYIATTNGVTCFIVKGSKIVENPYSIFEPNDTIITFKGTGTYNDIIKDLKSLDFTKNIAFEKELLQEFDLIVDELKAQITPGVKRLFVSGQSLGGAYATVAAKHLIQRKEELGIETVHLVTFGAPTLLKDEARNEYNELILNGSITLDRVVSQIISSRSTSALVMLDPVPSMPPGFSHPGFRPLMLEVKPESKGRPYGLDYVRMFYGVESSSRYRQASTWPFPEDDIGLGDMKNSARLNQIVEGITNIKDVLDTRGEMPAPGDLEALKGFVEPEGDTPNKISNTSTRKNRKQQGGLGFTEAKRLYDSKTVEQIPNFLSVMPSNYAKVWPLMHTEYFGMFFLGAFRLRGMKNPEGEYSAVFRLFSDGVQITYEGLSRRATPSPLEKATPSPLEKALPNSPISPVNGVISNSNTNTTRLLQGGRKRRATRKQRKSARKTGRKTRRT